MRFFQFFRNSIRVVSPMSDTQGVSAPGAQSGSKQRLLNGGIARGGRQNRGFIKANAGTRKERPTHCEFVIVIWLLASANLWDKVISVPLVSCGICLCHVGLTVRFSTTWTALLHR